MAGWTYADIWEAVAAAVPDRPAQVHGPRVVTWRDFDRRANALARHLIDAGLSQQSKVAAYLYNAPEYLETYYAAFKAGLAPVNTNYRYVADELVYLFDNADAEAVVFHASFADTVEQIRPRLPGVKAWVAVAEPGHPVPAFAADYEAVVAGDPGRTVAPWGRSGEDLLILYTGGTTGMPKGVMWRQDDLFNVLGAGGNLLTGAPPLESFEAAGPRAAANDPGVTIAAAPLMHGTAQFTAIMSLVQGGTVACLPSNRFNAVEFWDEVQRLKASNAAIVGMAFAQPLLEQLDANPGKWDLSTLRRLGSSGTVWSMENKQGLLKHLPDLSIFDSLGSSEAVGLGASSSAAGATAETAKFMVGPNSAVFTEDGRRVEPGSGERGLVCVSGFLPVGYYKDPEKTARTFREFEGRRWSVPGDFATVAPPACSRSPTTSANTWPPTRPPANWSSPPSPAPPTASSTTRASGRARCRSWGSRLRGQEKGPAAASPSLVRSSASAYPRFAGFSRSDRPTRCSISARRRSSTVNPTSAPSSVGS
jgi:fatty-acyl-CoA synthase